MYEIKSTQLLKKVMNDYFTGFNNAKKIAWCTSVGPAELLRSFGFEVYFSDQELADIKQNLIKQSIEIMRRRVDESGTKEPTIQAQGEDRILLQVPGVENSSELKSILGKTVNI